MTTLKTVSMYLRAAKTDAEEAGEATDGMASSVSELRSQILALTGNKVDIQIDENTFKSTYQILKELSTVWGQISDVSKANILEMVGGKRNANVVAALLENFEVAEKSLAVSADSAGSALAENEKQLNSIEGKIAKLSATFETLSQNVLKSDSLKWSIDSLNVLLKVLDQLAKINLLLPGILTTVIAISTISSSRKILSSVNSIIVDLANEKLTTDQLAVAVSTLNQRQLQLLQTKISLAMASGQISKEYGAQILKVIAMSTATDGATASTKLFKTSWDSLKLAFASNPFGFVLTAISTLTTVIYAIVSAIKLYKDEAAQNQQDNSEEMINNAKASAEAYKEAAESIEEYKKRISELNKKLEEESIAGSEVYNIKKDLLTIQDELIDKYGEEVKGINLVTGAYQDQIDIIDELQAKKYNAWVNENYSLIEDTKKNLAAESSDSYYTGHIIDKLDDIEGLFSIDGVVYTSHNQGFKLRGADDVPGAINVTGTIDEKIDAYNKLIDTLRNSEHSEDPEIIEFISDLSDKLRELNESKSSWDQIVAPYLEGELLYNPKYSEAYSEVNTAVNRFNDAVKTGDVETISNSLNNLTESLNGLLGVTQNTDIENYATEFVENIMRSVSSERIKNAINSNIDIGKDSGRYLENLLAKLSGGKIDIELLTDVSSDFESVRGLLSEEQIGAYNELVSNLSNFYKADLTDLIKVLSELRMFGFGKINLPTSGLAILSEEDKKHIDTISSLLDLYQSAINQEGLSGLDITETLADYPDLASGIIEVADGYNFTKESIEELIKAEATQLEMSAKLRRDNARENLISVAHNNTGVSIADWVDKIFEEYGNQISTLEDFKIFTGNPNMDISRAEAEYINSNIALKNVRTLLDQYINLEKYVFGGTDKKEKSAFEKAYDEHQHLLAMEQETQEEYLAWLEGAYKNAYATGQIELEDYYKYQEEVYDGIKELFDDHLNDAEHRISLLELDGDKTDEIISTYSSLLDDIESQIAKYRANGLDENSEYIQELTDKLNEYKESILEAIDSVVEKANESVDGIKGAYDTLTSAAKEYAENGYLSVDSLQEILELSPKYLAMLYDENGQLVINEKSIQAVMAARAEELGAETALAYAKKILIATENDELEKLSQLTQITVAASGATWDMAYATIALAKAEGDAKGYDPKYYEDAYKAIANMQKITKTSVNSISAYYKTLDSSYISQKDALEKIIDLTKELIEWEHEKKIEALEEEKEGYSDIIEQKKEMLELAKEQEDREKSVAEKIAEMAKLQAQITQLSLDDSREAQAQRRKLEEELSKLQKEVTDEQSDYAYDKQVEALDKELEEFEKSKDEEIKAAEDAYEEMYGSAEKLHQAAIDRMSSDWGSLYDQLLSWNYNYGSTLQEELVSAWDAASEAVKRYGSVVDAISGTDDYTVVGPGGAAAGANVLESMKKNALDWWTATASDQKTISKNQEALGYQYSALTGENIYRKNGSWFHEDGTSLFNLSKDEIAHAIVNKMKQNSAMWMVSDNSLQSSLSAQNIELADRLKTVLGADIHRDSNGVWWIGNKKLYDAYHSGGIVGNKPSLKQKEVMAVLEEGEAVLDAEKEKNLFKVVDFISALSERLGTVLDADNINRIFGGVSTFSARTSIDNQIGRSAAKIAAGIGGNVTVERIEVTAPIQVTEKLDDEEIRRHSRTIGAIASAQIKESFTKQGISKGASIF